MAKVDVMSFQNLGKYMDGGPPRCAGETISPLTLIHVLEKKSNKTRGI